MEEKDRRRDHPRFDAENLARNQALLEPIRALADAKGCSPAQIALAWLLAKGNDIVPIPGTKHHEYLEANAAAVEIALTDDEVGALDQAIPPGAAAGTRYPPGGMKRLNI